MKQQKSYRGNDEGKLYLVPTPIGNLEDITLRAIKMLKEVNLIASEDTRTTQKLLNHFEISTQQISFHSHNYQERIPQLIDLLEKGDNIAQVSDAGMPSISDPGHELVQACINKKIPVISLPGATAGVTALVASGLMPQPFFFYGFLPRKKKTMLETLENIQKIKSTVIFYESPYRVQKTLVTLGEVFGTETVVVLARELSKIHEEYLRGTIQELVNHCAANCVKGECCILLESKGETVAQAQQKADWQELSLKEHTLSLIETEKMTAKEAIKQVAQIRQVKKQEVYKEYHQEIE